MQFLMGLNETYSTIRGSILMMNSLPDTRRVHGLVLQHERQMNVTSHREPVAHAMQTHRPTIPKGGPASRNFNPRRTPKCSHCDGSHSIDRCYFLIGFPEGQKWHGKRVFPRNKRPPTAHNVEASQGIGVLQDETKGTLTNSPTFTTKEYHQLLALLRSGNGKVIPLANATDHEDDSPVLPIIPPDPSPSITGPLPNSQAIHHASPNSTIPDSPSPPSPSHASPNTDPQMASPPSPTTDEPTQHPSPSQPSLIPNPPTLPDHPPPDSILPTHQSSRLTRPPTRLKDYVAHHSALLGPNVISSYVSGTHHPLHGYRMIVLVCKLRSFAILLVRIRCWNNTQQLRGVG
ncbi:hypothetical protein DKX38_022801 [Salix brachista]|uniref:Uncharacterized protein n=1 Tax=Salix brachista TaxID=2182728 RepID=A0A5N5K138_9ROSI|nr:hypothetical protein DKX38_022801 [Salix brachista]